MAAELKYLLRRLARSEIRHEVVALTWDHLQQREEHWAIVVLPGKGGHVGTAQEREISVRKGPEQPFMVRPVGI